MEQENRTLGEKVSDSVAKFGGSWSFIITGFVVILLWVTINLVCFLPHWDDFPFILLNLFLSLIAAFQAPFILMAQKRVEVKQDAIYRTLFREIKELVEIFIEASGGKKTERIILHLLLAVAFLFFWSAAPCCTFAPNFGRLQRLYRYIHTRLEVLGALFTYVQS